MQKEEQELRQSCSGRVQKLEALKSELADANINKDQQQFDELIYMMKWINRFLVYVGDDVSANEILSADLQQFQRDLDILQTRHGWTIQEEDSEVSRN